MANSPKNTLTKEDNILNYKSYLPNGDLNQHINMFLEPTNLNIDWCAQTIDLTGINIDTFKPEVITLSKNSTDYSACADATPTNAAAIYTSDSPICGACDPAPIDIEFLRLLECVLLATTADQASGVVLETGQIAAAAGWSGDIYYYKYGNVVTIYLDEVEALLPTPNIQVAVLPANLSPPYQMTQHVVSNTGSATLGVSPSGGGSLYQNGYTQFDFIYGGITYVIA